MKNKVILTFLGTALITGLKLYHTEAHGTGFALEKRIDDYLIDIHYPYHFIEQRPILLNFFLNFTDEEKVVHFTDLDISISEQGKIMFESNINRKIGLATGVIVTFPEAGSYEIYVKFNNGTAKIIETSFPITVAKDVPLEEAQSARKKLAKEFIIGAFVGSIISIVISNYKRLLRPLRKK